MRQDEANGRRGTWWGATKVGKKTGAKDIPIELLPELKALLKTKLKGWTFGPSDSGGLSFKFSVQDAKFKPFIYHMKH